MFRNKRFFIAIFLFFVCCTATLFVWQTKGAASNETVTEQFGGGIDLVATGLEVTQGAQSLGGTVRLAAGKTTYVRFFVRGDGGNAVTTARLTASRAGGLVTLFPVNPGGEINVLPNPNRRFVNQSFLFQLPENFTAAGTFALSAEVNPAPRSVSETSFANNFWVIDSGALQFENVPPLDLVIYNIGYRMNGVDYFAPDKDLRQMVDWMVATYPTNAITYRFRKESIREALGADRMPACEEVNNFLLAKRTIDLQTPGSDVNLTTRYYGMVQEPPSGDFMRGCADGLPGFASSGPTGVPSGSLAWDTDGSYGDWYGSHEVLHNLNRYHAEFCNASDGMPFPNPSGNISPFLTGANAVFGFDIRNRAVYPSDWKDNMNYCENQWVSDFTSNAIMSFLQSNSLARMQQSLLFQPPQDSFLVQGTIFPTVPAQNKLEPLFFLDEATDVTNPTAGNYAIVLRNSANTQLLRQSFAPGLYAEEGTLTAPAGPEQLGVNELVPFVANVNKIEIENPAGQVIKSIVAGVNDPVVTAPTVGTITAGQPVTVQWTALDVDSDALTFLVQYSDDNGATWRVVSAYLKAASVGGGPVFSTTIDRFDLTAGVQSRFRVLASDGIHTGQAESSNFSIPNNPPTVAIEEPGDEVTISLSESVTFRAEAYDIDEGLPPTNEMQWSSSINGVLGSGNELTVSNLSLGEHTITFSVNDGDGGVVTDTITVEVTNDRVRQSVYDYDGDGESDIAVFRPSNGTWFVNRSSDGVVETTRWGVSTDTPVPADYDNDGTTDIAIFRPSNGVWYIRESGRDTLRYEQWGLNGDIPVPGDYDGDSIIDLAVFRPSNNIWFIRNSFDGKLRSLTWGVSGDKPVAADYDGDTLTDIAVFRASNNVWYIINSSSGSQTFRQFGAASDQTVAEDYDGDGENDIATWQPSNGAFKISQSGNGVFRFFQWGLSGDKPIPGDYDGDGTADFVVFRPSDSVWYIRQSSNGQIRYVRFGLGTDVPV